MNKKGDFGLERVVGLIIIIVFLLLIIGNYFYPGGMWTKVVDTVDKLYKGFIPGALTTTPKPEINVPSQVSIAYDRISNAFEVGQKSTTNGCLIYYDQIQDLQNWKIQFSKASSATNLLLTGSTGTVMSVRLISPNGQTAGYKEIANLEPCISTNIANTPSVTSKIQSSDNILLSAPTTADAGNGALTLGVIANMIFLFKNDNNHICFMPVSGFTGGQGLNNYADLAPNGKTPLNFCFPENECRFGCLDIKTHEKCKLLIAQCPANRCFNGMVTRCGQCKDSCKNTFYENLDCQSQEAQKNCGFDTGCYWKPTYFGLSGECNSGG